MPPDEPDSTSQLPPAPLASSSAPRLSLVVSNGDANPPRIECRRIVTLLGSRSHCKVCLRHSSVAPVHVALVNDGASIFAVDLVTRTGTLLNSLKMEHEQLNDGDMLKVGPWEIGVEIKPPAPDASADVAFNLEPAPQTFALEHVASHRVLQPNRRVCIIGRRHGCDIAITDPRVSRAHAILLTYFGYPAIFDLISRNQSFVNAEPISFQMLKNDDTIAIGDSKFRVRIVNSPIDKHAKNSQSPFIIGPGDSPTASRNINEDTYPPPDAPPDMIDIQATEGSQRWTIVESLERATKKK